MALLLELSRAITPKSPQVLVVSVAHSHTYTYSLRPLACGYEEISPRSLASHKQTLMAYLPIMSVKKGGEIMQTHIKNLKDSNMLSLVGLLLLVAPALVTQLPSWELLAVLIGALCVLISHFWSRWVIVKIEESSDGGEKPLPFEKE